MNNVNIHDKILRELLGPGKGFYVDVGANDPSFLSVTEGLYNDGWNGVNIEPSFRDYERLVMHRPRDINLNYAISNYEGTAEFLLVVADNGTTGLSTLKANQECLPTGRVIKTVDTVIVKVTTLLSVFDNYCADQNIDLLKIDVEGGEKEVIESNDWSKYRPSIVAVESTYPLTTTPSYGPWEHILTGNGYTFVKSDGINRFYMT